MIVALPIHSQGGGAGVGRPWTPKLKAEQQAVSLIRFLFDKGLSQSDVLQSLATDETINDRVRHRATELAGPYADNLARSNAPSP